MWHFNNLGAAVRKYTVHQNNTLLLDITNNRMPRLKLYGYNENAGHVGKLLTKCAYYSDSLVTRGGPAINSKISQ